MNEPNDPQLEQKQSILQRLLARIRSVVPFALGVLAAFLALMLYNQLFPDPVPLTTDEVNEIAANTLASATPPPAFSAKAYEVAMPSLVLIQSQGPGLNGDLEGSLGSGVVITGEGDILTSLHVVENATSILLTFADGTQSLGEIVSAQPENDIAVLRAYEPPNPIVPAVMGNPGAMRVGDDAFVIGNPFGLYGSMSAGVISGFDRSFQSPNSDYRLEGLIQIDTAVNPGNSGGPLLNRDGHVVGIVVGILNPTQDEFFVGIGFAVPISIAGGAVGGGGETPPY